MTTYGVSYWGRGLKRAFKDAERLADAGFSWVNVPISEERMAFDFDGRGKVIAMLRHFGLEVRVSPWGVGGMFGGEGIASARKPRVAVRDWLERALDLEPDALYWDEPQGAHGRDVVEEFCDIPEVPQHIYINPKVGLTPHEGTLERMASIGIDCYDGDLQRAADESAGIRTQYGKPVHIWLKAFRIPRGVEHVTPALMAALAECGLDIAIWGYPSPGVSCLDNDRPRKVWRAITDAMEATCSSSS